MKHWLDKVVEILESDTSDLRELAKIAGSDPKFFYVGANFRNADLTDENLKGIDLTGALLNGCKISDEQKRVISNDHSNYRGTRSESKYVSRSSMSINDAGKLTDCIEENVVELLENFSLENCFLDYSLNVIEVSEADGITVSLHSIETLLRYRFNDLFYSAAQIIPILEANDLIAIVDTWVMEKSCAMFRDMRKENLINDEVFLNVNVSLDRILDDGYVSHTMEVLRNTFLSPQQLMLDIQEPLDDYKVVIVRDKVNSIGCLMVIDWFGTYCSSPENLKLLAPDYMKIDRSILHASEEIGRSDTLEKNILIVKNYTAEVICAGVESRSMYDRAGELGCAIKSGYYFSKPLNYQELHNFLGDPDTIVDPLVNHNGLPPKNTN